MYIYFNSSGALKEIITEEDFRGGDARDVIYFYIEGEGNYESIKVKYRLPNGELTNETDLDLTKKVILPIPPGRNLKYFSYKHTTDDGGTTRTGYLFYKVEIPASVLQSSLDNEEETPTLNNLVYLQLRCKLYGGNYKQFQLIPFSVQSTIGVLTDGSINYSQYDLILNSIDDINEAIANGLKLYKHTITGVGDTSIIVVNDKSTAYVSTDKATDLNRFFYAEDTSYTQDKLVGIGYLAGNQLYDGAPLLAFRLAHGLSTATILTKSYTVGTISDTVEEL